MGFPDMSRKYRFVSRRNDYLFSVIEEDKILVVTKGFLWMSK